MTVEKVVTFTALATSVAVPLAFLVWNLVIRVILKAQRSSFTDVQLFLISFFLLALMAPSPWAELVRSTFVRDNFSIVMGLGIAIGLPVWALMVRLEHSFYRHSAALSIRELFMGSRQSVIRDQKIAAFVEKHEAFPWLTAVAVWSLFGTTMFMSIALFTVEF